MSNYLKLFCGLALGVAVGCGAASSSSRTVDLTSLAPEATPANATAAKGLQTAVFAGGCFWGVEAVYEHVKGVTDVKSGYSGGGAGDADYENVSSGNTAHAEAVEVTYDPTKVSYVQLLTVFFSVAHNPTEVNRQGPDTGRQYRSAVFFTDEAQKKTVLEYIEAINKSGALAKPVATEVVPLERFFEAEEYHQDYMKKNPDQSYIVVHDKPKVEDLKKRFSDLYVKKWL